MVMDTKTKVNGFKSITHLRHFNSGTFFVLREGEENQYHKSHAGDLYVFTTQDRAEKFQSLIFEQRNPKKIDKFAGRVLVSEFSRSEEEVFAIIDCLGCDGFCERVQI